MKKAWMLLLSLLMVLGTGLTAKASSRSDAMSADINVVEDYDLIFTYPNKVLEYKNTVDYRLESLTAGTSDDWAGVLDGKHEKIGVVGVYLHRFDAAPFMGYGYNALGGLSYPLDVMANNYTDTYHGVADTMLNDIPNVNPLFDLFWGKEMGKLGVGVKVSYADSKMGMTEGEDYSAFNGPVNSGKMVDRAYQADLQIGVGMKDLGPFQEANFSAGYLKGIVEMSQSQVTADHLADDAAGVWVRDNGIYSVNANINLKHELSANDNLKVFANYRLNNFGLRGVDNWDLINGTATTREADRVATRIRGYHVDLGLGCNHTVNEGDGLVSAGLKAQLWKNKNDASMYVDGVDFVSIDRSNGYGDLVADIKMSTFALPVFVSVEAKVKSWLTLRAGASYYLFQNWNMQVDGTHEGMAISGSFPSNITFNTGFGLSWKNWVLDGVLDTDDLEDRISRVQPGRGIMFNGSLVHVAKADLKYKF